VMDKCLLVGTASTRSGINIQYTGVTIRNTIMVRPNTPAFTQGWNAWVARRIPGDDDPADTFDTDDPVEIYGNTMVNLMDDATRDGRALALEQDIDEFETFSFENNVAFTPNAPGQQPEDPHLSMVPMETAGGVWRSRFHGTKYRDLGASGAQLTMNARFATPPGTVGDYLPLEGSPVIESASGRVPVDDFVGRIRGEMPDRGARELEGREL
jgi:murein DD-endopeptidase MepM/ murein hydrolase activator NlpD